MSKKNRLSSSQAERFNPDIKTGLNTIQVEQRKSEQLVNIVTAENSKSYFKIVLTNTCTFFNLLCLVCFIALVSVRANIADYSFVVVYVANAAIGIIQEIRAKRTLEKLSIVSAPTTKVVRDGNIIEIPLKDIVLDDIIVLELGNQVPADCILISGKAEVNESLLTGESVPVKKAENDVLMGGSFVSGGNCYCRVDKIGNECYAQQLSIAAKKHKNPNSKLLNAITSIIKGVGILIVPIACVMGFINYKVLVSAGDFVGFELIKEVVTRTSTVIIGMIPAGMLLLTTMALAVGAIKLSRVNTLVRNMYSLEMLARVDVLCLDKTGTITDGRMNVMEVIEKTQSKTFSINDIVYSMQKALNDNNQTANALKEYFNKGNELAVTQILPFNSARKLSAVSFENYGTFVLGAPNFILETIDAETQKQIECYAKRGSRVIMLAHSDSEIINDTVPSDLSQIALIAIQDNIRKEAIETIAWFKQNDVSVKVISGDDPMTVSEISRRAGVENYDSYVNLYGVSNEELVEIANKYTIFGRVSPEQKAILVKALKSHGHTVAMTGDGVNDILAMKEADCSITVAAGSSAAKSVAHLILTDNNFNSMPKVVAEGRRVINNIQQSSSLYLMKTLFTLSFALISIISFDVYPFTPRMIIMLETIIIGLASFALSLQPNENRVSGNFITQVFKHAIPGALILVLNVFIIQLLTKSIDLNVSDDIICSMEVVVLTFGGWIFLLKICSPVDKYRGIMLVGITTILLVWLFFLMDTPFFNIAPFSPLKDYWTHILIMVCIIQFDYPLLSVFIKIMEKIGKISLQPARIKK